MEVGSILLKDTNRIIFNMYYYKLLDRETGEHYIGSSTNLKKRIQGHKDFSKTCYSKSIIERNNYEIIVLEISDEYNRIEREQYWMDKHPNRINKYNAQRKLSKKEYNKIWQNKKNNWVRSWGDPRYKNCLLLIDVDLFI
mgnify:FL=1